MTQPNLTEMVAMSERLRTARSAVAGSPFYTAEQKEAAAFTLDLIEFGEVRPATEQGGE